MTDPRLAPLAAALRQQMPWRYDFAEDDELGPTNAHLDARAILAALPPDWCGHGAEMLTVDGILAHNEEVMAEIARLRAALKEIANTPWLSVRDARGAAKDALDGGR